MIGGNSVWFAEELTRRLKEQQLDKSIGLGRRDAGDYADYSYGCGVITGLELAIDVAEEIRRELDK